MESLIRLQKVLSESGIASRRGSEAIIKAGRVRINGNIVKDMGVKVGSKDIVSVDNKKLHRLAKRSFLFFKPQKVITSCDDEKGRTTVTDFFPSKYHLYPVGRLDYDTSGLIIMTNDGDLANILMHPRFYIPKTYVVKVKGILRDDVINKIQNGVRIKRVKYAPAKVKIISVDRVRVNTVLQITLREGKNHEIKNIFSHFNFPVRRLTRIQISFLKDEGMKSGMFRELTEEEIGRLKELGDKNNK